MASDIDARVAREVMGWDSWRPGLPFSTDMNAAMEVVEKMFALDWLMELSNHRNVVWFAWFKRIENEHEFVAKQASRPALAICLAALEAVKNG